MTASKVLIVILGCWLVLSQAARAEEPVRAQLAQSLHLLGVGRVHRELGITGKGVGVLIIDDWTPDEQGLVHGQAVADIIRAVAPGARLSFCKLDFEQATEQDFTSCLTSAMREPQIRVVNISFSIGNSLFSQPCDFLDDPLTRTIRQLSKMGVVFVAAAGNNGIKNALLFPACLPETISVGASYDFQGLVEFESEKVRCRDRASVDQVTCYSNVADFLKVVAPGTVISTPSAPDFGGTSAAAPIVSGVIALMLQADPTLSPQEILQKLQATASQAFDPATSRFYPRVDAYGAVKAVKEANLSPIPSTVEEFDTNGNGLIDDEELFAAIDRWLELKISEQLFFMVLDAWVQARHLKASGQRRLTEFALAKAERIELFDLQGRRLAHLTGAAWPQLLRLAPTLAKGVYPYVAALRGEGGIVRRVGKLIIMR